MTKYRVTTTVFVEADDPKQAAMKAFVLHDTMTPEEYTVNEPGISIDDLLLTDEDKDEARRAYAAGEYFREVKLSDLPR